MDPEHSRVRWASTGQSTLEHDNYSLTLGSLPYGCAGHEVCDSPYWTRECNTRRRLIFLDIIVRGRTLISVCSDLYLAIRMHRGISEISASEQVLFKGLLNGKNVMAIVCIASTGESLSLSHRESSCAC